MSREIEDGMGFAGLVATRAEREQDKRDQAERKELQRLRSEIGQLRGMIRQSHGRACICWACDWPGKSTPTSKGDGT